MPLSFIWLWLLKFSLLIFFSPWRYATFLRVVELQDIHNGDCAVYFSDYLIKAKILYLQLLDSSQTLLPADELKKRFDQEGVKYFLLWIIMMLKSLAFLCS